MNNIDFFKNLYTDFYGVEEIKKDEKIKSNEQIEMEVLFKDINSLYIDNESKDLLKKMLEYMRKYSDGLEKNYVPFRIIIKGGNDVIEKVTDILYRSSCYYKYIENSNKLDLSLYKLDKIEEYNDNSFIFINDLKGINLKDNNDMERFFFSIEKYLKTNLKSIVIIAGTSEENDNFFMGRENIKNTYFSFVIRGINPDIQDIYQQILNKLDLNDHDKVSLLDYIENSYKDTDNYLEFENSIINYISFNKKVPLIKEEKSTEEVFKELNELVGLKKVKKALYDLVDVMKLKDKTENELKIKNLNLHMVFLGNPGTGKTTIARLVANILYNLGYIKENKLIEVSSKDLVAEYVGQTAPKTMSVIEKAMNGVLFIDEAYSLAVDNNNSYNAEAIATLIQAMENYRDKLVVIFAGYTREMQDFLDSNSGIVSRIGYTFEFDDYTTKELVDIFLTMTDKAGFKVDGDALKYLEEIIDNNRNTKNFGNARFVRNIYEKSIVKHASRVKNYKKKEILITLTKEDISIDNLKID